MTLTPAPVLSGLPPAPCAWCLGGAGSFTWQRGGAVAVSTRRNVMNRLGLPVRQRRATLCSAGTADDKGGEDETPPEVPLDWDLLRRRMREVETDESQSQSEAGAGEGGDNDVEVEVEVDLSRDSGTATPEEAKRLVNAFEALRELYIIVYTSRRREEGVYSLELGGENIVLAFQERAEAQRYATLLETQKFPTAKVCRLEAAELKDFCQRGGYRLGFVPKGSVTMKPPDESAIDDAAQWGIGDAVGVDDMQHQHQQAEADKYDGSSGLTMDELQSMKRRLDSLFGGGSGLDGDGDKDKD